MFQGGYRRYAVFLKRCARDGMTAGFLIIAASLCGMAIGQAVIDVTVTIISANAPWELLAKMTGLFVAWWALLAILITLVMARRRYNEDQEKFIKVMTEKK